MISALPFCLTWAAILLPRSRSRPARASDLSNHLCALGATPCCWVCIMRHIILHTGWGNTTVVALTCQLVGLWKARIPLKRRKSRGKVEGYRSLSSLCWRSAHRCRSSTSRKRKVIQECHMMLDKFRNKSRIFILHLDSRDMQVLFSGRLRTIAIA